MYQVDSVSPHIKKIKKTIPPNNLDFLKITLTVLFYVHAGNIFTAFLTRYGTRICRRRFELKRNLSTGCSDPNEKTSI
jgi:hypothetical protein